MTFEDLVDEWLPLPDVAERLGTDVGKVRRLLQEDKLLAVRQGERRILAVPAKFLIETASGWEVVPSLQGTLVLLRDAGFSDEETVAWLFTPDPSLESLGTGATRPSTPVDALRAGHKTEIRRRAQALAL
ncbi:MULTISPECIES: Rv2175c family DNA-binding protein [unclassified Actinotalea]|uniref:Rv2175c family DNA-binding protein n=1 Tax=unclassified Actinotalea TaxID=2638618 RepID=UPI0015F40457|nr:MULTISPECIES: Rv2175c family DNA-binding protein [unclassified Actinotalea]